MFCKFCKVNVSLRSSIVAHILQEVFTLYTICIYSNWFTSLLIYIVHHHRGQEIFDFLFLNGNGNTLHTFIYLVKWNVVEDNSAYKTKGSS